MIAETTILDLEIAVISALLTGGLALLGVIYTARRSRERSSREHAAGTEAVLAAVGIVHDEVRDVAQNLKDHIKNDHGDGHGIHLVS